MNQPTGKPRKLLRKLLRSLMMLGFGLLVVFKSIGWMIDGKMPNLVEAFSQDRPHGSEGARVRAFNELLRPDRQLGPLAFWITGTIYLASGSLLLVLGISNWTAPWYRRKKDRRFYDSLGSEDPATKCSRSGCHSGTVRNSRLCKRHYFERHSGRECPFEP
jgi:hypothetical protein